MSVERCSGVVQYIIVFQMSAC